jgi:hypothetical protein
MSDIVPIRPISLFRALDKLSADGDRLIGRLDELDNLPGLIRQKMEASKNNKRIEELIAEGRRAATPSKYDEEALTWCHEQLEQRLDPAEGYENNDRESGLRRNVVSTRLATMIGAFPASPPGDPEIFARVMIEHVFTVDGLTLPALDSACREIVATHKFFPTTGELLKVLGAQQAKWERRLWAISSFADRARETLGKIGKLEIEALQAAKARAVEQAQRDLDRAHKARAEALAELAERRAAVASSEAWLALCEDEVSKKATALAEAIARQNHSDVTTE